MPLSFSWPGKKDEPEARPGLEAGVSRGPGRGPAAGGCRQGQRRQSAAKGETAALEELTRCYGQLGLAMEQANQQVLAYLIERHSQAGGGALAEKLDALAGKIDRLAGGAGVPAAARGAAATPPVAGASQAVQEKLDQLDARLKTISEKAAAIDALKEAFVPTLVKVRDGLSEQHAALGGGIRQVQQQFDEGLRALAAMLQPVIAHFQPPPEAAPISGDWQEAILGRDLAEYPGLDRQRQRLLSGFLQGEPAACALVGQLLVFRSSPAEKMPTLLKDIGEAYYRWNPRTAAGPTKWKTPWSPGSSGPANRPACPTRSSWSIRASVSIPCGTTPPNGASRITQVFGWIVLRDNGKVYTKASVAVK